MTSILEGKKKEYMLGINHKPSLKPTVIFSAMSFFTSEKILHCITDVLGCKVSYSSFIQVNPLKYEGRP